MSGFKSRFWKKTQDRVGSTAASSGVQRGTTRVEDSVPHLREISAVSIERYLEAVHQYTLIHHATVAPWLRGRIPVVMLEHELPRSQEKLLGRMAKHHILHDGTVSSISLTAGEVRSSMIDEVIRENVTRRRLLKDTKGEPGVSSMESGSNPSGGKTDSVVGLAKDSRVKSGGSSMDAVQSPGGSEAESDVSSSETEGEELKKEALRDLFPHSAKKSRETERSNLWKEAANLLGKMLYFWPSKDIQVKMLANTSIVEAFENTDVIRFIDELRIFSLAGSGNPEANREAAEKHLMSMKMRPGKALEYFKDFTEAVEHIRMCKSSFTEFKVVDLFFRNIDQTSFPNWYIKFLTEDDPLYRFQKLKFEEAKDYALKYQNNVIRVNERTVNTIQMKKAGHVKSVNQLRSVLAGTNDTHDPIAVDPVVLATLFQKATATNKIANKKRKSDEGQSKESEAFPKKIKKENNSDDKKICFKFRDEGKCEYGANCYFAHIK
jgi:hypothetical protein